MVNLPSGIFAEFKLAILFNYEEIKVATEKLSFAKHFRTDFFPSLLIKCKTESRFFHSSEIAVRDDANFLNSLMPRKIVRARRGERKSKQNKVNIRTPSALLHLILTILPLLEL